MAGQKKEGERRGRKVDDAADEWVQTRSERERKKAMRSRVKPRRAAAELAALMGWLSGEGRPS